MGATTSRRPLIEGCACGQDHDTMPMIDVDHDTWIPGVCLTHKLHIPCRSCDASDADTHVDE